MMADEKPFFNKDAMGRIRTATRRTEQTPAHDLNYGSRTPHLHRPYHDFLTVDSNPVSGLHIAHVSPVTQNSGFLTFVERGDVPVYVYTPSFQTLRSGGIYWGRCGEYVSGAAGVSGYYPTYVVDDCCEGFSGSILPYPVLTSPTLVEPVSVIPASGITSGSILLLLSGTPLLTMIGSLGITSLSLTNINQVGQISLTASQTVNDLSIIGVDGKPQFDWNCKSGIDTAYLYDPLNSGKALNIKQTSSGKVTDTFYDPLVSGSVTPIPVIAIGVGVGFGVGGGIGGGIGGGFGGGGGGGGGGGFGGGGGGGGILIFVGNSGAASGTLGWGVVISSGQGNQTFYGPSGQVVNQKTVTNSYVQDIYYPVQTGNSGNPALAYVTSSGQTTVTMYYSGGAPANIKTVTSGKVVDGFYSPVSGVTLLSLVGTSGGGSLTFYDPVGGPFNGGSGPVLTEGFGLSGPQLLLGQPIGSGPNLVLGFNPTTANPLIAITPGAAQVSGGINLLAITDTSGNLLFGLDGSGLKSGSVAPWQQATPGKSSTHYTGLSLGTGATIFDITDTNGILGVLSIKNTSGSNTLTPVFNATNQEGSISSGNAAAINPGGISFFDLQQPLHLSAVVPPLQHVQMIAKDGTSGSPTGYSVYFSRL